MTIDEPTLAHPGTPPAEVGIDAGLVRSLLAEQHPDLLDLELRPGPNGWDNSIWRLGERLALRLPRREIGARLIRSEQLWLPEIARRLSVPVPEPVRVGSPGPRYPWPWSVVRWIDGEPAAESPLLDGEATAVGGFLRELHIAAPPEAPHNPFRAVPVRERYDAFDERLERLRRVTAEDPVAESEGLDLDAVQRTWERYRDVEIDTPRVWIHGDLHPKNVVTVQQRLAAVIDWGDLTAGDPATDLAGMWLLFPTGAHAAFLDSYGAASPATVARARAWALLFGVMLLDTGLANDPTFADIGRTTLLRACEGYSGDHSPAPER